MFAKRTLGTLFGINESRTNGSVIHQVHQAMKPNYFTGALSGYSWRHRSIGETLECITNPNKYNALQRQAQVNLQRWAKEKTDPPLKVEVVYKDWGVAALEATQQYGVLYTILTMANSLFPGGAVLSGGSAQEENVWHRSSCALSLLDQSVYLDKATNTFRYDDYTNRLIEAKIQMTSNELQTLLEHCSTATVSTAYKVLFSQDIRICFRGPEMYLPNDIDDCTTKCDRADSEMSYLFLPQASIFPFYELRSSAPEQTYAPNIKDPQILEQYKIDLRRRIEAQLNTLIIAGRPEVILGAWGCGAFGNHPKIVAQIYREAIEERAHFFRHIIFPIINNGAQSNNYSIFNEYLDGIKLGGLVEKQHYTPGPAL